MRFGAVLIVRQTSYCEVKYYIVFSICSTVHERGLNPDRNKYTIFKKKYYRMVRRVFIYRIFLQFFV